MSRTAAAFDVPRFSDWLGHVTGEPAEVTVTPIRGGASCEMFRVEWLGQSWVVRRAPLTSVSDTAHHVVREARSSNHWLARECRFRRSSPSATTPRSWGLPSFVMSYVDGAVVRRDGLPEGLAAQPKQHHAVGEGLIDTLVSLHEVDWRSTPLARLSRPEGFLARQVDRWMSQLESYRSRDLDGVDDVAAWLATNRPAGGHLTVMHGDYKLDNVLWSRQPPPQVLSVVDFEMTTVGDPLIDLAWALIFWPEEGNLLAFAAPGSPNGLSADQCQSPSDLAQRYATATGRGPRRPNDCLQVRRRPQQRLRFPPRYLDRQGCKRSR